MGEVMMMVDDHQFDDTNAEVPYSELGDLYTIPEANLEIVTWTPRPAGNPAPGQEQVHLMFNVSEDLHLVIRLKSADAVNRIIRALEAHRQDAFGK